jgi:hypothetical protein
VFRVCCFMLDSFIASIEFSVGGQTDKLPLFSKILTVQVPYHSGMIADDVFVEKTFILETTLMGVVHTLTFPLLREDTRGSKDRLIFYAVPTIPCLKTPTYYF